MLWQVVLFCVCVCCVCGLRLCVVCFVRCSLHVRLCFVVLVVFFVVLCVLRACFCFNA